MGGNAELESLRQQVEMLKQQLSQAQKLTALGELVSTTTHEFNNVLMTIINYAKLGMRHKDNANREKCFDKILAAGNRAARITNGVLGMARNRAISQEPVELAQLIEDTLLLLEREMNKYRITVEKQYQPTPKVTIAAHQVQQILLNMLINARQAMPNGGRILVKLAHDPDNQMVDLVIRDYGCGIPQDKLLHIFDPFFTTKSGPDASGKGGTGLGLSMCRDIMEAHRGRIRVESTVGKGTAFTLKFPVAAPPAPVAPVVVAMPPAAVPMPLS